MNFKIMLASRSPARLDLLKQIGIIPDYIIPPDIDETELKGELAKDLALRLAYNKALHVSNNINYNSIIISADTVVSKGRKILPKALNDEDVRFCMQNLSGRRHSIHTGICLIKKYNNQITIRKKLVQTKIKFKRFTNQEIEHYVNLKEGINMAGGYTLRGFAESFIIMISGSYSNVIGLPLYETHNMLKSLIL